MSPQWNESLMRLTLRGGSVYYLQHHSLTSPEPHYFDYFVILNLDPQGDEFLVVLVALSKVEKVENVIALLALQCRAGAIEQDVTPTELLQ